jgi:hypothetical protein
MVDTTEVALESSFFSSHLKVLAFHGPTPTQHPSVVSITQRFQLHSYGVTKYCAIPPVWRHRVRRISRDYEITLHLGKSYIKL